MALGLFVLWIVALATGGRSWLASWTLVLACAFLLLAGFARSKARSEPTLQRRASVSRDLALVGTADGWGRALRELHAGK